MNLQLHVLKILAWKEDSKWARFSILLTILNFIPHMVWGFFF